MFWAMAQQFIHRMAAQQYDDATAQEELIFPPLPDRPTSVGYYTSQSTTFVEHAKRHDPTCIEFYTTAH